jgi:ABC-type glycerol-3-phosphate transport system permease component
MSSPNYSKIGLSFFSTRPPWRLGKVASKLAIYILALIVLTVLMIPIAWMISTSLKPTADIFEIPLRWIPTTITLENFSSQFNDILRRIFLNSVIVGIATIVLSTFSGALSAYAIARYRFWGTSSLLLFFLASMAFPIPLIMVSMYILFVKVGLLDTYAALVLGHTVVTLPVVVWLLKNFFDSLPIEVEEAAFMEGAGPFYTFFFVVLPMSKPAVVAAAIFVFVTSWNEFMFGLIFITSNELRPLPVGISMYFLTQFDSAWSQMMAVAIIVTAPILVLFLVFQKSFTHGVTAGAVKG